MNVMLALSMLTLALIGDSGNPLRADARIDAKDLTVGDQYEIVVRLKTKSGWSGSKAGIPAPLLQIEAPDSVTLVGTVLTSRKELAGNEYLSAPYERLLEGRKTRIKFTLDRQPAPTDVFHLNVLAYVGGKKRQPARFLRQRLELQLAPRAKSAPVDVNPSDWGRDTHLQLGETADEFELPSSDGSLVSLSQFKGKSNVIVTTYRAHW